MSKPTFNITVSFYGIAGYDSDQASDLVLDEIKRTSLYNNVEILEVEKE